jgi:hypothetical protein
MYSIATLKNQYLFLIIMTLSLMVNFGINYFLISDTLYYNDLAEQLTTEKIDILVKQFHKWGWLSYVAIPITHLIKFLIIALVLFTGFYFFDTKVSFSLLFKSTMLAEIPFLIVPFIKLCWFLFVQTQYDFKDLQYFYPLSALQLFDIKNLSSWQIYPLRLLNIFEIIYWLLLAYWLKHLLNITLTKGMQVVASSYGTSLLLWVVFVVFLSLNMG